MKTLAGVSMLVLGVLAGPSLASAQTAVTILDDATLLAKGGGALMQIEYTCGRHDVVTRVILAQPSGNKITIGSGSGVNPTCPFSTPQTEDIVVTAENAKFKVGPAIAQAFIFACPQGNPDPNACEQAQDTREIRLHK